LWTEEILRFVCVNLLTKNTIILNCTFANCEQNMEIGHLCWIATLKNEIPGTDVLLFVSYDFETTHCEMSSDVEEDCERCGERKHTFWDQNIGDLLSYLCEPSPWVSKVVAIAHNAWDFDWQFIMKRAFHLKRKTELPLNGLIIVSMKIEHTMFIDSVTYLPMPLRRLNEVFGLSVTKSWYRHYFNKNMNLDYVGPFPDISYSGADEMSEYERREIMSR